MSKKTKSDTAAFIKQLARAGIGVITLILLLVIWLIWDNIWSWFYHDLFPNAPRGTLLMFWLLFLFPLLGFGVILTIDGGIKAYRLASPAKEK